MISSQEYKEIDNIIELHDGQKSALIAIMQDIQKIYRYLPKDILLYLSKKLGISDAKIYSVATFYENFSLEPKGKHVIKICDGTACHVRKSVPILDALRKDLRLTDKKETTDDMLFTLETVSCLGACGLAPVITVNDKVYASMTPDTALDIIYQLKHEEA